MTELFLTLIIIFSFICTVCVVAGIGSKKKAFPLISVCCCIITASLAFCTAVEMKSDKSDAQTKAYIPAEKTAAQKTDVKKDKASSEPADEHKIVYITKTGDKYHYSYNCSDSDFYECTLEQALERGLEPCGRCVK